MSPSTGRIYDRNRTSIALIYASSTARLREESIYVLLGATLHIVAEKTINFMLLQDECTASHKTVCLQQ